MSSKPAKLLCAIVFLLARPNASAFFMAPSNNLPRLTSPTSTSSSSLSRFGSVSLSSRRRPFQRQRGLTMVGDTDHADSSSDETTAETQEELSVDKVASMMEVSFVQGVMQLATGYVETVKLFIAAVLTGYGMRISCDDLVAAVDACPVQSANRPLMAEEQALRTTWTKLIYLVAQQTQYRQAIVQDASLLSVDEQDNHADWNMYQAILPRFVSKHAEGDAINPRFQAQEIMTDNADLLSAASNNNDPMAQALLQQNLRILWLTLTVMEEEKQCQTTSATATSDPPAPFIPNEL